MAVRLFFFLLVFVNLLFFAWVQGYFGQGDENREPLKLEQQLQADKLRIVSTGGVAPASVQPSSEVVCRVVGGLSLVDAEALKSAASAAGADAKIPPLTEPTLYLVRITDLPNKAAADKKVAELTRFGVAEQETVALNDGRHEIILARFPAEAAAREFLQGLIKRGIKSARVDARDQAPQKASVELRAPATSLLRQLPQLIAPYADASLAECAK
jgi:hypothetical protein